MTKTSMIILVISVFLYVSFIIGMLIAFGEVIA